MPVSPSWPGVYVQEVPSGVRTIAGVSTSVALFIGYTKSGPIDEPTRIFSFTDYVRAYGDDTTAGDMTQQVKLAFLNGLTDAYVLRVAEGTVHASITLLAEDGTDVLTLTAASPGIDGNNIRAAVTYDGNDPEGTFNLTLFRWVAQPNGLIAAQELESWSGLSMDPSSGSYVETFINSNSKLVTAAVLVTDPLPPTATSTSTSAATFDAATFETAYNALITSGSNTIRISIDGSPYVSVTLPAFDASPSNTATRITAEIQARFTAQLLPFPSTFQTAFPELVSGSARLSFTSTADAPSVPSVKVRTGVTADAAVALGLGAAQGGLEIGAYAARRPAATGVTISPVDANLTAILGTTATTVTLDKYDADGNPIAVITTIPLPGTTVTEKLEQLRDGINAIASSISAGESFPWKAELWGWRLAIVPTDGPFAKGSDDNRSSGFSATTISATTISAVDNVRYYSLGTGGTGIFQTLGVPGNDGSAPSTPTIYDTAYGLVEEQVDLFNLLVLPRSNENRALVDQLWPNASVFAEKHRALLLMEPPESWSGVQVPSNEIASLRIGVSKQFAALYYPRIQVRSGSLTVPLSPVGAVAGIMARTDNARGVWKAPAGTEATIRGITGVEQRLSDAQNGVLNPKGINVIRQLPDGVVVWGARTMDGYDEAASEYKYAPVRRLANFIAESLYRGLRWVVFEPNDEPLWAQIRLNVGAFMHNLFRQGAFQGQTKREAYFVKCDAETTTQNDINLGIVNVWVGFAPLKPAEFVILYLQQMAGQIQL